MIRKLKATRRRAGGKTGDGGLLVVGVGKREAAAASCEGPRILGASLQRRSQLGNTVLFAQQPLGFAHLAISSPAAAVFLFFARLTANAGARTGTASATAPTPDHCFLEQRSTHYDQRKIEYYNMHYSIIVLPLQQNITSTCRCST